MSIKPISSDALPHVEPFIKVKPLPTKKVPPFVKDGEPYESAPIPLAKVPAGTTIVRPPIKSESADFNLPIIADEISAEDQQLAAIKKRKENEERGIK